MDNARQYMPGVAMCADPYSMAQGCDAILVLTEWNEFKNLDLPRLRQVMNRAVIMDGRNIYDPQIMEELGFHYRGMGRGYNDVGLAEKSKDELPVSNEIKL
jgi:UDPglucose 6-dehydrogenase